MAYSDNVMAIGDITKKWSSQRCLGTPVGGEFLIYSLNQLISPWRRKL